MYNAHENYDFASNYRVIAKILWIISIIFVPQFIYSQNNYTGISFILDEADFDILGLTNEKALIRKVNFETGRKFDTYIQLNEYLEKIKQEIINKRFFKDVSYTVEGIYSDDKVRKYKVNWKIEDSWTLFAIPYPKFDSNSGLRLGLQAFYDNAFGTMTNWFLGARYDFTNGEYNIRQRVSAIKIANLSFSVFMSQDHAVERKLDNNNNPLFHWSYNKTSFGIHTVILLHDKLSYSFFPTFNFRYDYKDIIGKGGFKKDPFDFSFKQILDYYNVNWIENFRDGLNASLGTILSTVNRNEVLHVVSSISMNVAYYKAWKIINSYSKAGIDFAINAQLLGYGANIRGVIDDTMYGDWASYISTSLGIQFWRWEGVWDAQVHPFVDIGIVGDYGMDMDFKNNFRVGAGMDFVLYLDAVKNMVARGTIGFDLTSQRPLLESYEIIITSQLHY